MSMNLAMNNLSSMQVNYAQTSTVSTYDTHDVWNSGAQQGEEAGELQQQAPQQEVAGARTAQTAKTASTQQTAQTANASEAGAAGQAQESQDSEVAARTLRLSMADNSRELQAKFGETQAARGDQQTNMSADARRQVMLRNMENMVNLQLAQYTGNEPYSKANYREILGAVTNMQNGASKTNKDEKSGSASATDSEAEAGKAEEKDGVYKLYSGQAAKTLSALNSNNRPGGDDNFDLVA